MRTVRELERELAMRRLDRQQRPRNEPRGNLSAYCIGASIGAGARHDQCPGVYHGQACTCACGHPGY